MINNTSKFSVFELHPSAISHALSCVDSRSEIEQQDALFDEVFSKFTYNDSCSASKLDRKNFTSHMSLTYGEISSMKPLRCMLDLIRQRGGLPAGGRFYDLGSGIGRPVVAAAILHNFDECTGIEILPSLHAIAEKAKDHFLELRPECPTSLRVVCGSMFNTSCSSGTAVDWTDGDVVYANSTCYDDDMVAELSALGAGMRPGSHFITLSRTLQPSDGFRLLDERRFDMSW